MKYSQKPAEQLVLYEKEMCKPSLFGFFSFGGNRSPVIINLKVLHRKLLCQMSREKMLFLTLPQEHGSLTQIENTMTAVNHIKDSK